MHKQNDHVVQYPQRFLVIAADHLVDHLAQLLRAERFGGVQAAVNPDHGLAFLREGARLFIGQVFGQRQATRDLFVAREVLVIGR